MRRQTYFAKAGEIKKQWRQVDATDQPLGRLAVEVATVLMGKHRPEYTPHVDSGDFVIVTNATKVAMTGNKAEQRLKDAEKEEARKVGESFASHTTEYLIAAWTVALSPSRRCSSPNGRRSTSTRCPTGRAR